MTRNEFIDNITEWCGANKVEVPETAYRNAETLEFAL